MNILLDSTVLFTGLRGRSSRSAILDELVASGHDLATTVINVAGTYAGLREQERSRVEDLFDGLYCYEITNDIAVRAGELKGLWQRKGFILHLPDVLIAAVALKHGLALFTDNMKDFPMEDLVFYQAADPSPNTFQ